MALYPCAPGGLNDYVFLMAVNPRMWAAVCRVIGKPDLLEDPRFATADNRREHREALMDEIAEWTLARTKGEAMQAFAEAGICASQVYETHELFSDRHLVERGFVHELDHPEHGQVRVLGWPARMSGSSVPINAAPLLGEHTDEVLAEDLALDAAALGQLREQGAIGREQVRREERHEAAAG